MNQTRNREWQIGLFGTFDVENYGDLLFPLMAQTELTERLGGLKLHRFSYHAKTPPDWPYRVISLTDLPQTASELDAILIGGGLIIRFDKEIAPGYFPPVSTIHHPTGYWLGPALTALQHGTPLIWNAPGMHGNEVPGWAHSLIKLVFAHSNYIAVRDEPSRRTLASLCQGAEINVVPDTAFGISRLLDERPSIEFQRLREAAGLTRPYIIIQAAMGVEPCLRFLRNHRDRLRDFQFLELPIGPVLGDGEQALGDCLPEIVRLASWPAPLMLAELISRAEAVIGHSYHLAITALASGVPVFTLADRSAGKYSPLLEFDTVFQWPADRKSDPELDWFLSRVGRTTPSAAIEAAREKLIHHWDRVAEAVMNGNTTREPAIDQFWQSLPRFMETAATGQDLTVPELQSVEKLKDLLARAQAELNWLYGSRSWKITAPFRFATRALKRLRGRPDGR